MKIGILNDTHIGVTTALELQFCFENLAEEEPDLVVHAGDFCGDVDGYCSVYETCNRLRTTLPDIPIVAVIGNHDLWTEEATLPSFKDNLIEIKRCFQDYGIFFLDQMGNFIRDNITICGASGWYNTRPDSNDWKYIPKFIEGDTHAYLCKQADIILTRNLENLWAKRQNDIRIFVSHFPVRDCNPWDGNPNTGRILKEEYAFDYFISGHSHGELNGPIHFRTSTDYGNPQYKILDI